MRRLSANAWAAALTLLFFVLYYLYLWLAVDLRLIYHGGGVILNFPVFYLGWDFFRESVSWPGGFVEYISAFLAQFFYFDWAGALIATFQAWLLWLCTGAIIRIAGERQLRLIYFVAPILLLILYTRYTYPFGIAMDVLAALGFLWLYMKIPVKSKTPALLVFQALSIILYVIAGLAYLLFAMLCVIYELLVRRRWLMGAIHLAITPIVAYVAGLLIFNFSIGDIIGHFQRFTFENGEEMMPVVVMLYLFLPIIVIGLWLLGFFGAGKITTWGTGTFAKVTGAALPFAAGLLIVLFSQDGSPKPILEVDYYASRKMWPEVLQYASQRSNFFDFALHPSYYRKTCHAVNRALYHTGRLGKDIFAYHQRSEGLFINSGTEYWEVFDTYIDLGQINRAEYSLLVCIEVNGQRPLLLKRLVLINMAKGNTGAASVYLGALDKTLFDAGWAKDQLEKIERDPNLSTDEEIQQLRSMIPTVDRNFQPINDNLLLDLLDKNRHNRMAFEYLEAFYLLSNQHDKFEKNLDRLNDFDYRGVPRVYEEAMLLYSYTKKTKVEIPGREISVESRERFNNFLKVLFGKYGGNKKAAFYELAKDYGDSYFFYSAYGLSGMKQ